jgi:hypothetical protein
MGTYGRNFHVDLTPQGGERKGRYCTNAPLVMGAPVVSTGDQGPRGTYIVEPVTSPTPIVKGKCGIALYEYATVTHVDDDPHLTTYSDHDQVFAYPLGPFTPDFYSELQLIVGTTTKVTFTNVDGFQFLHTRHYDGRIMVAGTPSVGDFLTPGPGDDINGYWQVTTDRSLAWLVIREVRLTSLGMSYGCGLLFN